MVYANTLDDLIALCKDPIYAPKRWKLRREWANSTLSWHLRAVGSSLDVCLGYFLAIALAFHWPENDNGTYIGTRKLGRIISDGHKAMRITSNGQ